jgi:protein phosphatase
VRIRYAARTDVGLKRTHNEDYFALIEEDRLFMVADGMGGHASGDVASKMSTEVIGDFYRLTRNPDATWPFRYDTSRSFAENRMIAAIRLANARIFDASQRNRSQRGMGTTIVTLHLNGDTGYIAHVGDSRCYLLRDGRMDLLTRDHSLLEDWKDARPELTEQEIRDFPHKNVITRALGMRETVDIDVRKLDVRDDDRFLLCSDGLSGMLDDDELLAVIEDTEDPEDLVAELVDRSNAAGGEDNITAMIVACRKST